MTTPEKPEHPPEVVPGEVVGGKWKIVAPIGRGGMGAVFEGQNITIGKKVALKFIDAEFARQPDVASRFQREAEAASLVESAHIVHIFDSGTTETGIPYIVMELLRGEDLRARLRRLVRLPKEEAVHIVAQTLRGLHRAHEAGIVHRDLKPDNIFLVDRDDDPLFAKIVDFGISKITRRAAGSTSTLTRQGVVLGTPFYMSPEQAQALPMDHRTDLWSIGAILYECLVGRPPHTGDAYEQIIISICTTDAVNLRAIDSSIPEALSGVVHRALTRDPQSRFQTAREMLDALLATGLGVPSHAGLSPRTIAGAPPAGHGGPPGSGAGAPAPEPGGRTRVSWTSGDAKPAALAATILEGDEQRQSRAKVVRRRGLVVLGVSVMVAAFILTSGFLRARKSRGPSNPATRVATVAASASAAPASSEAAIETGSTEPRPKTDPAVAVRPAPLPAFVPTKGKKGVAATGTPVAATPPAPSPVPAPAPSANPGKTGIAGGLQIKTNYP